MTDSALPANPGASTTPVAGPTSSRISKKKIAIGVVGAVLALTAIGSATKDQPVAQDGAVEAAPPAVIAAEEWTVSGWADRFAAYGFSDATNSPLADGTPRKMMERSLDSATSEAIGDAANLDRVSLMVGVTAETGESIGELMGAFLNTYAPGTRQDVVDQLTPGADFTVQYAGGSVHVIGIPTGDGSMVTLTVDRD